ncbi:MAG: glycosyltransferase [Anaerolineaceae bacterium]|nr:MAG: glycosyltransferase [Anaerolineaceae bacterium]
MLSICMIVKNEENILENCLEKLSHLGYEIVIADTGSTDKSKEIALRYTDKVYDYAWDQDFAAARNYVISKASNEYIMMIDADEIVVSCDKDKLEDMIHKYPDGLGRLLIINDYSRKDESYRTNSRISRLFSKELYHYEGRIHEQLIPRKGIAPGEIYDLPVHIYHGGYEGDLDTRTKKTERNINLLLKELADKGDDPYILYQLGKSFYMREEYSTSCEWFGKALNFDLDPRLEYVQDMVESYGYALLNSKQYETAMGLLGVYDEFAVSADFVYLMGLIYMNNARFKEAIAEFIKATKMIRYKMDGVNSYRAYYNIGVIYECLGQTEKANTYYSKCGDYKPALQRLKNVSIE